MAYDVLIKSGSVIDGSGVPPILADVGIKGDKITAVGDLKNAKAGVVIEAFDKYVVPGFIDITNHSDTHLTLFKYPNLSSMLMQGVTTVIGGNCGASLAPLARPDSIEAIKKWADIGDLNINWTTIAEFFNELEKIHFGVNFGTFIGFGTIRRGVVGSQTRALNFEELQKVKLLLQRGLKEGALGISLGLSYGHEKVASTEEIIEIARVVHEVGGVVKIHLRSEGKEIVASVNEAISIGREAGVSVQISHLKAVGKKAWPFMENALELVHQAKSSGLDINFDVSPYRTTGSALYLLIPSWAREGGFTDLFRRIDDMTERGKIIDSLKNVTLHYDRVLVISAKIKNIVGKTLAQIATMSGVSPEEALLDTVKANEGRVTIVGKTLSTKNVAMAVTDENSFISSDGAGFDQEVYKMGNLVHPRSFGTFPHFWHHFVQDLKTISPESAVRKCSSGPAEKMGLLRRGLLKKNYFADIVVLDPKTIKDRSTYQNPFRYAAGIESVLVNGRLAVERSGVTGIKSGRILKLS